MSKPSSNDLDVEKPMPTVQFYSNLQEAFDYFNQSLFESKLPPCMLTLRSANRFYGYHQAKRFIAKNGDLLDELGLHPGFFALRPVEVGLSTLVHEMVHHWQNHFGTPTSSNPHNVEWGNKMEEIGLMPTSTGLPGGKKTGRNMTHYIMPEGRFIQSCMKLVEQGFDFAWYDRHAPAHVEAIEQKQAELEAQQIVVPLSPPPVKAMEPPKDERPIPGKPPQTAPLYAPQPRTLSTRVRMQCTGCGIKVTLSKETHLICGPCGRDFEVIRQTI